jgi:hypothetical protein
MERRLRTATRRLENVRFARDSAIGEAAQQGMSHPQIAEATGLSQRQVGQIVKGAGAAARRSRR